MSGWNIWCKLASCEIHVKPHCYCWNCIPQLVFPLLKYPQWDSFLWLNVLCSEGLERVQKWSQRLLTLLCIRTHQFIRLFYQKFESMLQNTGFLGMVGKNRDVYEILCEEYLFIYFYWSIVALQCCVSFCWTTKWLSHTYTYTYIPSPSDLLTI